MRTPEHHLRDIEEEGSPTIVLVPGLDGTALLFYRQIPLLARKFNVIAFPLPDDPDCGMSDLIEDLRNLIVETCAGPVVLCGESFGGALSMSFALAHPDVLSGIVIINSFSRVPQRFKLWTAPYLLRALPWAAMPLVRRFTEARLHSPHAQPEDLEEFHERSRQIGRRGYIRRIEILQHYDIRDRLGEISVPTLFLAGDRDKLVPSVEQARHMGARVPDAEVRILEGYGHICLINHDLDLLEHVGPWFDRAQAAGRSQP
jgi:pimeloyl-ACP methyl ester carboxylesterase